MWKTVKLGYIYDVGSSKRVLKSEWKEYGIPFYRGREITALSKHGFVDNDLFIADEHYEYLASKYGVPEADDIMITAIGTIGNTYIVQENDRFYFKDASVLWLKKKEDVLSRYVQYWLLTNDFQSQLDRGNGATVDTLTIKKLSSVLLPFPPLAEQRRIVAKLDKVFAEIDKAITVAECKQEEAAKLKQTLLKSEFDVDVNRYKSKKLGEVIKYDKRNGQGSNLRYIGMENISTETMQTIGEIEVLEQTSTTFKFDKSHVLFGRLRPYLKKVLVPDFIGQCSTEVFCLLPSNELDRRYLAYWLLSPSVSKRINDTCTGARMPRANMNALLEFLIPIPSFIEQKRKTERFDATFSKMDNIIQITDKQVVNYQELKSAILAQELQGG